MTSLFRSEQGRSSMRTWHEHFRGLLPAPVQSRTVETSAGQTHLLVGGPADGEPVVLLHGALASSAHALGELSALLQRFRVYAVDVIGQSVMSADARLDVRTDAYGRWLAEVMDALELPRAHVIGVSWGGFVAQQLATTDPGRIERLVLLVPAGLVSSPPSAALALGLPMMMFRTFGLERSKRKLLGRLLTTPDDDWGPFLADAFGAYRLDMRVPPLTEPAQMAALRAPVLVIAGDGDLSFPGAALLERAREVFGPDVQVELVENCRHCPPTTASFRSWLGDRVGTFLAEAPNRGGCRGGRGGDRGSRRDDSG